MEKVPEIESKTESHMTSAAAFVEGGIQESCDDACSICLEEFCESDPSTVTTCRHKFHLQCILEWCQRSSQCPMCWQPISLKDPTSQELFEGIEQERKWRATPSRNATILNHPALGDFGLQHLRMGVNDDDFEERLLQHLAAAAMGRAHHLGRRERLRMQSSPRGHPHFLVFSTQPDAPSSSPGSAARGGNDLAAFPTGSPFAPITSDGDEPLQQIPQVQIESSSSATSQQGIYTNNRDSSVYSSPTNQDEAGPSDFESFSDSLRSKLSAVSLRYKESISKGAKGWKERFFSRSSSMSDLGSEARKEVGTGIASVSRLAESLETRENNRAVGALSIHLEDCSMSEASNQNNVEAIGDNSSRDNTPACSASSHSS